MDCRITAVLFGSKIFVFARYNYLAMTIHRNIVLFGLLLIFASCSPKTSQLFNGNDLSGWTVYGTEKWYVENNLLICESGPDQGYGYLATDKFYKDFELTLEFKQGADGNSGVFFRSTIEDTKITGWQAEVAPPGKHTGGIYESYGRGWLIKPEPALDRHLEFGAWNTMKIVARGNEVSTWLNGQVMISLVDEKIGAANGSIALQIHDGGGIKVAWRNIRIREL